jgi:hypothetical protein
MGFRFTAICLSTLALAGILAAPAPAFAAKKKEAAKPAAASAATLTKDWQVGMIKNEKGDFGYCLMRGVFNNGLDLAIALSPKQEINLGVGVPKAGFTAEEKHEMLVTVDGIYKKSGVAVAPQPELLLTPMGSDKNLMSALKKGKVLQMQGPEDTVRFSLKNAGKALDALQQCVGVGTGKVKAPKETAGKGKAPGFPPALKELLQKAGLEKLEIVPIKDPSKAPVDFAWTTKGVFGGMRERTVPADATLEKMSGIIEKGYKDQCPGTFNVKMGNPEELPGVKLRTAEITCQKEGHNAAVALLFYLTDTNLFTLFMHETEGADSKGGIEARDKITAMIRDLAKQPKP